MVDLKEGRDRGRQERLEEDGELVNRVQREEEEEMGEQTSSIEDNIGEDGRRGSQVETVAAEEAENEATTQETGGVDPDTTACAEPWP
ncbi:hypothetical protein NDU88_000649 [Pleurodeles waltl]|uniref:Uncharacterized protein n=1 Tax=Pleurodeles waltl TaxID=8319 RepID=A0AAV7LW49_PLEWA|nr:hypothetical protein NDU88_000649 [Pleurodeles waltl]